MQKIKLLSSWLFQLQGVSRDQHCYIARSGGPQSLVSSALAAMLAATNDKAHLGEAGTIQSSSGTVSDLTGFGQD